jgi:hypothetical protein
MMLRHVVCAVVAASLAACYEPASTPTVDARVDAKLSDAKISAPDAPPLPETDCTDGFDGDLDGKTDCADSDCAANGFCVCHNIELPMAPGNGVTGDSFGRLDIPGADREILTATSLVRGWALDSNGIANVKVRIDNAREVLLTYGTSRADVCDTYPGFPGCNNVGFQANLDVRGLSRCEHLFEIVATDGLGTMRVIDRRRVVVN